MALTDNYTLNTLPLPSGYVFNSPYSFDTLLDRIYELYSENGWVLNFSDGVLQSIKDEISELGYYDYGYLTVYIGNFSGSSPFNFVMGKNYASSDASKLKFQAVYSVRTYGDGSTNTKIMNITRKLERGITNIIQSDSFGYGSGFLGSTQLIATSFNTGSTILYPIAYRLTNCSAPSAPTEAAVGDTVTVTPTFTDGYGVVNPSSDVYVTCNGVTVPSIYTNGVLTFTMPDPS